MATQAYGWYTRAKPSDYEALVQQNVAPGASAEGIYAFLDREKIFHGKVGEDSQFPPDLSGIEGASALRVITAIVVARVTAS